MRRVVFGLAPGGRETPFDYVSRLAFRNGREGVRAFCADFRLGLRALAGGEPAALEAAAALGRTDPAILANMTFRPVSGRRVVFCGCEFHSAMVARQGVRLCPVCLDVDLASGEGRAPARHWRRAEWLLRDIRTCHVHQSALMDLGPQPDPRVPDFSRAVSRELAARSSASLCGNSRMLSHFERYVLSRLGVLASNPNEIFDHMPVHACIRLAEVTGAVALDGLDAKMSGISDDRLGERQRIGFDLVSRGREGVRNLLERGLSGAGRRGGQRGPQALLGPLYLWLAHPAADPSLDSFRELVREVCLDRLAIGPGDAVAPFGNVVDSRRVHSIRSASVETGIHHTTLRNVLTDAGIVENCTRRDDLATFDAVAHAPLLRDLSGALDLKAAADRLGVHPSTVEGLVKAGLVTPILGGIGSAFRHYRFRARDIDRFVFNLAPRPATCIEPMTHLKPLPEAARAVAHPVVGIATLLLGKRLAHVSRDLGATGLCSLLVDPSEIRAVLSGPPGEMVHPKEVKEGTGLPLHVIRALVKFGLLEGQRVRHAQTRILRMMVTRKSFERFSCDHVTLAELAKEAGIPVGRMWRHLSNSGLVPVIDHRAVGAVLYRRADIPRCL